LKRALSFLKNAALFVTVLCVLGLVLSSLAPYVDPREHWWMGIIGLGFLPLFGLTVFLFVFWIIVRIRFAVVPLVGLLAAVPAIRQAVSFNVFNAKARSDQHDLRVMTYNVRNFDLYNWSQEGETRRKMMSLISDERPDIACFQEFYYQEKGPYANVTLLGRTGFKHHHTVVTNTVTNQHWGIATFSKFPIVGKGRVDFPMKTNNTCIYTDIDVRGTIVRVYNVHLQSIYLTRKDYAYIEDFNSDKNKMNREANQRILTKLRKAFERRAEQVELIDSHMRRSPYPVLLCGDFNDTPVSFTYNTFRKTLADSFAEKGWGMAPTYAGMIPLLRIDYMLHDPRFITQAYRTKRQDYSDHYPVVAEYKLTDSIPD
jgi:endonuclease/exonuclease/phosphatase family metal-dependent hydrolase